MRWAPKIFSTAIVSAVMAVNPVWSGSRTDLYSVRGVNNYCAYAQMIVANTALQTINIVHDATYDSSSFTTSSAAPYDGPNSSRFSGQGSLGTDLYPTTQQMITSGVVPYTGFEYPKIISCKMKDAESLVHYGWAPEATQSTCRAVNQMMVHDVYATLTNSERRYLRYQQTAVVFDDDVVTALGPGWLDSRTSPQVYLGGDGQLHVRSQALPVARTNPSNLVTADKKGVYYCHFPAPEHFRAVITGAVTP